MRDSTITSPGIAPSLPTPSISGPLSGSATPANLGPAPVETVTAVDTVEEPTEVTPAAPVNPSAVDPLAITTPIPSTEYSRWGEDAKLSSEGAGKRLLAAMKGWGCNEQEVFRTLADRSLAEIAIIRKDFRKLSGDSLNNWLKSKLGGASYKQAKLLLLGESINPVDRDAQLLNLAMEGAGTNESMVLDVLHGSSDEHRKEVAEHYEALSGKDLEATIKSEHTGTEEVFALAAFRRGEITAADRVYAATRGLWNDYEAAYRALEGKTPTELVQVREQFQAAYGKDLEAHLESRMSGRKLIKAKSLLAHGEVAPEDSIKITLEGWSLLGWGISPATIQEAFEGKTDEEREQIRLNYAAKYGDLSTDIKAKLSTPAYNDTMSVIQNGELSEAERLNRAMRGYGYDKNTVIEILNGKTMEELAAIKKDYRENYGEELITTIHNEAGGEVGKRLAILVETGHLELVDKIYFATSGLSYDKEMIFEALGEASEEERANLSEAYSKKYHGNIEKMFKSMYSTRAVKRANYLHEFGTLNLRQKLEVEMTGWGANKRAIFKAIEDASEEERREIQNDYDFMDWIAEEVSGKKHERIVQLLDNGSLTQAQQLYFAIEGWGTDESAIHSALRELTAEDKVTVQAEYRRRYGRNLLTDLRKDLDKRDFGLCEDALAKEPKTLRERADRMVRRVSRERGSGTARSRASDTIVDAFTNSGFDLDQTVREYMHLVKQVAVVGKGERVDEDHNGIADEFDFLLDTKEIEVDKFTDDYVKDKEEIANKITNVAVMTVAATSMVATGGLSTPAALGAVAAATAATKVGTQLLVQGDSYNLRGYQCARDLVTGAVTGGSMVAMGAFGKALMAGVGAGVVAAGGTTGGAAATGAAQQMSYGFLQTAGSDFIAQSAAHKILCNAILGGFKGALSSGITGATESAMKDETWDQEILGSVKTIFKDARDSARSGAKGWAIGSAAYQMGAIASQSVMVNLKLKIGSRLGAAEEFTHEELVEAGHDILGDEAGNLSEHAVKAAGHQKLLADLGENYLKNTTEGKLLGAAVSNAVTRGVAAYPKTLLNKLSDHSVWENGLITGLNTVGTAATEAAANDAAWFTLNSVNGIALDEAGIEGAKKVALQNLMKRGLKLAI